MDKTSRMIALLRRLRTETNGAVSAAMEERDIHYPLNYGVSIPIIRQIATEYAPDHELALLLFQQDVRELRLSALYIDDPAQVSSSQIGTWSRAFTNVEIAEQAAMHHLSKISEGIQVAMEWLLNSDVMLRYTGLMTALWIVRRDFHSDDTFVSYDNLLRKVEKMIEIYPLADVIMRGIIALLQALAVTSTTMREEIKRYADELFDTEDSLKKHIGNETKALVG